ncbi:hypothetical protein Dda_5651 [Drechslerella dactyloides]|uniref:Uncharacterized protein n=1 Tax=Drechslerella dactyloides TaxID=74499 RepID=A0AAD6NHR2_DREDA|nr:hypothetical protein Dda_5651 [Drechslerella dactyloides]
MSQQPAATPPILATPQITHPQSPRPPPSPTSSTCSSSTATDDISDSGEDDLAPSIMEPSDLDFLTHGDLRSPGREHARERSLRKKGPHRGSGHHTSAAAAHVAPPVDPGVQPQYPSDDEEDKRKSMTPEERARARKKAKKTAKAEKKRALKAQETVKIPRKREDRRREDEVAAVEASMASLLRTTEDHEDGESQQQGDDAAAATNTTNTTSTSTLSTHDRQQRRRSSNTLPNRPAKPRKSSSGQVGSGSNSIKSPKIGTDPDDASVTPGVAKRGGAKHAAAFTQYNVEEGLHERAHDIDRQMAALAKMEIMGEKSRGGKLARGLEELEKRKMERKQNEALMGVVEAAQERFEDEQLARLYGLK